MLIAPSSRDYVPKGGTYVDHLRYTTPLFMSTVPVLVHRANHFRVNLKQLQSDTTDHD